MKQIILSIVLILSLSGCVHLVVVSIMKEAAVMHYYNNKFKELEKQK